MNIHPQEDCDAESVLVEAVSVRVKDTWAIILELTRSASYSTSHSVVRLHSLNLGITQIVIGEEMNQLRIESTESL